MKAAPSIELHRMQICQLPQRTRSRQRCRESEDHRSSLIEFITAMPSCPAEMASDIKILAMNMSAVGTARRACAHSDQCPGECRT